MDGEEQSRERDLTARLNAATALLQSFAVDIEIDVNKNEKFKLYYRSRSIYKLQKKIALLECEAYLGFKHKGNNRLTLRISIIHYIIKIFKELDYDILLFKDLVKNEPAGEKIDVDFLRDAVMECQSSLVSIQDDFYGVIFDSEPTADLFRKANRLLAELGLTIAGEKLAVADLSTIKSQIEEMIKFSFTVFKLWFIRILRAARRSINVTSSD